MINRINDRMLRLCYTNLLDIIVCIYIISITVPYNRYIVILSIKNTPLGSGDFEYPIKSVKILPTSLKSYEMLYQELFSINNYYEDKAFS